MKAAFMNDLYAAMREHARVRGIPLDDEIPDPADPMAVAMMAETAPPKLVEPEVRLDEPVAGPMPVDGKPPLRRGSKRGAELLFGRDAGETNDKTKF